MLIHNPFTINEGLADVSVNDLMKWDSYYKERLTTNTQDHEAISRCEAIQIELKRRGI